MIDDRQYSSKNNQADKAYRGKHLGMDHRLYRWVVKSVVFEELETSSAEFGK